MTRLFSAAAACLCAVACSADSQQLEAHAGEEAVSFEAGEHVLEEEILIGDGVVVSGAGMYATTLRAGARLDAVIRNADAEGGNERIELRDLTVDCAGNAVRGILFIRTAKLQIRNVRLTGCRESGLKLSGHGERTRDFTLSNIVADQNGGGGVVVQWAMRDGRYDGIYASNNGGAGIVIEHSELTAINLVARGNRGNGIFLRNLFATTLSNLTATHNGGHGILVQGWVHSAGTGWRAQGNSQREAGRYDDLHFSGDGTLSYGRTRNAALSGVQLGNYHELGAVSPPRQPLYIAPKIETLKIEALSVSSEDKPS